MNYYKDITYYLELALIDKHGNFVTGNTVTYKVYKSSDESLFDSGTLTEIGVTGVYKNPIVFTATGQYRAEYTTPVKYDNVIETFLIEEVSLSDIDGQIKRLLGLSQENYRIFNQRYDRSNNLIEALIKLYPTADDCENDTNAFAEYEMTAVFDRKNHLTGYKTKRTI